MCSTSPTANAELRSHRSQSQRATPDLGVFLIPDHSMRNLGQIDVDPHISGAICGDAAIGASLIFKMPHLGGGCHQPWMPAAQPDQLLVGTEDPGAKG